MNSAASRCPSLPPPCSPRDADLQTLRDWLVDPAARLITLTGPGGAGKTRLVLELARERAEEGSVRVVFVSLARIRDAALVASTIAEALGMADVAAVDLPRRARAACRDQVTLLVVDNFEQVLDAAPLIADLLTSVPQLRALVTSSAPLRVRGEREYAVGPLELDAGSEAMPPADLARIPAVRLFMERVRDVQPDFRLTAANGSTVTEICRRLDALPRDLFICSLDQFRALAIPWGTGSALTGLAWVALVTGDAGQVERLLDDATLVLGNAGPWFLSLVRYLRAVLAVRRGNPDETIALIRESLTRIAELRDKFAFVNALVPLAAAAVLKGDDAWAARILGARDAVTERTGATVVDTSVDDLKELAEREVRARLGPDRWARAYAAGRMTSIDALLKDIDGVLRRGKPPIREGQSDGPVKS